MNSSDMEILAHLLDNIAGAAEAEYEPNLIERSALWRFQYYSDQGENERLYLLNLVIQAGISPSMLPLLRKLGEDVAESVE